MDFLIFGFMVTGSLAGSFQHFASFENVAKDLSPVAFNDNQLNPATSFWGGDAMGAHFLANGLGALVYSRNALCREAYLLTTGFMFTFLGASWARKGHQVGNPAPHVTIGMDLVLGSLAFLGAFLTRSKRLAAEKRQERRE